MRSAHTLWGMPIDVTAKPLTQRVAEEIRVLMLRRGVKGAKLAEELGVSAAWVSYRLNGQQAIDLTDLERIAGVLEVDAVDLVRAATSAITLRYATAQVPAPRRPRDSRPSGRPDSRAPRDGRPRRIGRTFAEAAVAV